MWKWMTLLAVVASTTVSAETNVLAFAGSTRDDSINKKLLVEAADIAKQAGAKVTVINLKDYPMPFYDGDLEANKGLPPKAKELRQLMMQSNVILIASPEYNGSLSGVLKNTIDWATRNEAGDGTREAFLGKKFVLLSASPGQTGGARGLEHLRTILTNVGGVVATDQIVVPDAFNAFNEQGKLKDKQLSDKLKQVIQTAVR